MSLDNATMTIYGDSIAGNCLKVKFVAERLGLPYDWVEIDVRSGATHTPEFLAMNPAGQVPVARFITQHITSVLTVLYANAWPCAPSLRSVTR